METEETKPGICWVAVVLNGILYLCGITVTIAAIYFAVSFVRWAWDHSAF